MKFKAADKLIQEYFNDKSSEITICFMAHHIAAQEKQDLQTSFAHVRGGGLLFRQVKCNICRVPVNSKMGQEMKVIMFDC